MLSRWTIARKLVFEPWRWLMVTLVWLLFARAATIRDNFLPVEWRARFQVLDYLPAWSWSVWIIGVLLLTIAMLYLAASRWIAQLDRALNDRELPGRNADEIAPWRERGRTLTNQWRHLRQHGTASQYQHAEQEADEWRRDIVQRLERKYGLWVATHFNETREADSEGLLYLSHLREHDARAERLAQIMYDVGTGRIPARSQEPF